MRGRRGSARGQGCRDPVPGAEGERSWSVVACRVVLFDLEPGPRVPVGVRVRGGVAGLADQCLFTVMDKTCVGVWMGASPGDCFKTVDSLSVCDWVGHISITGTQLITRVLRDARI
jgi:hypothetical protein